MVLRRLPVDAASPFLGKTLKDSGIRNRHHCLVAGIEKADGNLHVPDAHLPLEEGDILWLGGCHKDLDALFAASICCRIRSSARISTTSAPASRT